jgi:hypothetical protein
MLVDILNKILLILFFMSSLNVLRHVYYFIQAVLTSTEEEPKKYRIPNVSLYLLGVSIAYILSAIITGITL